MSATEKQVTCAECGAGIVFKTLRFTKAKYSFGKGWICESCKNKGNGSAKSKPAGKAR